MAPSTSKERTLLLRIASLHCYASRETLYSILAEWLGPRKQRLSVLRSEVDEAIFGDNDEDLTASFPAGKTRVMLYKFSKISLVDVSFCFAADITHCAIVSDFLPAQRRFTEPFRGHFFPSRQW
jgi:hypothetical protein